MADNNQAKINWGETLKVEVGDLSKVAYDSKPKRGPLPIGKFPAIVSEISHGTFKKGSYGLTVTYTLTEGEAKNRQIREYIVLNKADGTPTMYGAKSLKQRLMNFGIPLEKLNNFKGPKSEQELGDFKLALDASVTVAIKDDGEYNGAPSRKVQAVYLRESND